ncbi:MAG: aspartyl/glutamyl-tRNA amidotransferase subunit B [Gammaproteobacteria bacterium RIFCSPLOWO2_02_FULL_42_9]|nr:MAG: aspartyl/glutamyl-tRNA amidotransferase subunit B [Gammaproteobacteria bacterium RIFCSPLOWO2_02_FULL_42_9]
MNWKATIGLEVHIHLKTKSKMFSGSAASFGAEPNSQASIIDLGFPGTLPVLNKTAVDMAIKFGLAVEATVANESIFARKNYFYPDLPKGYQISQHSHPIVQNGYLDIVLKNGISKKIGITRAHLEEDSGKSLHEDFHGKTGIDLNRAGMPLLEIVSEPDITSAEEAVAYLKTLHTLVQQLDICTGNMQEGAFRCDVNVSVRPKNQKEFGTRTETKNLNSFRFVERTINYEIERQINILKNGGTVIQQTLLFDVAKNETRPMRAKEEATDYRYFPEPDLLPLKVTDEMIQKISKQIPELPKEKRERFAKDYKLNNYIANLLANNQDMSSYFETVAKKIDPTLAANWIFGELSAALNKAELSILQSPISATELAQLLARIEDGTVSGKIAKTIFERLWHGEGTTDEIIEKQSLKQVTDENAIEKIIDQVLRDNPDELAAYRAGKDRLFGFFVGQVMQLSTGKANPQQVNDLLKKKLL